MHDKKKLGDGVKKAIARTAHKNEVVKGVNEYGKTAWNSWMKKEYPLEKPIVTDKPTKHVNKSGATPGQGVRNAKARQNEKNRLAQGRNDHKKVTGLEPNEDANVQTFGPQDKSIGKKRFGAGEGVVPSGTNTHIDKAMAGRKKRKDGSFGC